MFRNSVILNFPQLSNVGTFLPALEAEHQHLIFAPFLTLGVFIRMCMDLQKFESREIYLMKYSDFRFQLKHVGNT